MAAHSKTLVLATHNAGKVTELQSLLAPLGWDVLSAGKIGLPEPDETGTTFAENATIKAQAAARATGLMALADDSGLCLLGLKGWPGVDTAKWTKSGEIGLAQINERLTTEANGDYRAQAFCVLALAHPHGSTEIFEGRIDGEWAWPPRGNNGFGFDPTFIPDGQSLTYAEMGKERKGTLSHRAVAFKKLLASPPFYTP